MRAGDLQYLEIRVIVGEAEEVHPFGIEPVAERIAQSKPAAGVIDLEVGVDHQALQITVSDDGRGLALAKIRRQAIEHGWLAEDEQVSDEAIAELIFRPGFSTAQTVSEVSGRGVGMDAVRDFVRREQGHIELRFTDDRVGADFRRFQTVVWLPETWAVDSLDAPEEQQDAAVRSERAATEPAQQASQG